MGASGSCYSRKEEAIWNRSRKRGDWIFCFLHACTEEKPSWTQLLPEHWCLMHRGSTLVYFFIAAIFGEIGPHIISKSITFTFWWLPLYIYVHNGKKGFFIRHQLYYVGWVGSLLRLNRPLFSFSKRKFSIKKGFWDAYSGIMALFSIFHFLSLPLVTPKRSSDKLMFGGFLGRRRRWVCLL